MHSVKYGSDITKNKYECNNSVGHEKGWVRWSTPKPSRCRWRCGYVRGAHLCGAHYPTTMQR